MISLAIDTAASTSARPQTSWSKVSPTGAPRSSKLSTAFMSPRRHAFARLLADARPVAGLLRGGAVSTGGGAGAGSAGGGGGVVSVDAVSTGATSVIGASVAGASSADDSVEPSIRINAAAMPISRSPSSYKTLYASPSTASTTPAYHSSPPSNLASTRVPTVNRGSGAGGAAGGGGGSASLVGVGSGTSVSGGDAFSAAVGAGGRGFRRTPATPAACRLRTPTTSVCRASHAILTTSAPVAVRRAGEAPTARSRETASALPTAAAACRDVHLLPSVNAMAARRTRVGARSTAARSFSVVASVDIARKSFRPSKRPRACAAPTVRGADGAFGAGGGSSFGSGVSSSSCGGKGVSSNATTASFPTRRALARASFDAQVYRSSKAQHSTAASSPSSCATAASSRGVVDVNELPTRALEPASLRRESGAASRSSTATATWSPRCAASRSLMRVP
mmetsp:Transcript_12516/g.32952  ORF Transcript_12516/g.32952 Transcript_12516/m.32952 type:complete len:451 (+) Transcript_12516:578-1930(+)